MKKVIYYNTTLLKGGTDKYMFELIKNIDKTQFSVDVIVKDGDVFDEFMYNELTAMGTNVYLAKGGFKQRISYLMKFFKEHKNEYDIAHINATSEGTGLISLFAKKFGKVKKVVFHSHMGGIDRKKSIVDKVGTKLMFKHSDVFASCSTEASLFMYGKKFVEKNDVRKLNNSVDTKVFNYYPENRERVRKELNLLESDFVVLHVGRFAKQKNHEMLIDIFNEVVKKTPNSVLLLIGNGELFDVCKSKVENLGLIDKVKFLGLKNNVYDYMQAADCFVMPSVHEGLPIVAVEAQATGLPCVLSANISRETKLSENVNFIGIDEEPLTWADEILKFKNHARVSGENALREHKFDHSSAIKEIENLYSL